jgi:hypothetical protein
MAYLKKILDNCVEASVLALKNKEVSITLKQKFEMRLHIMFCKCCKNFSIQSSQIDTSLKKHFEELENNPPVKVSDDFKKRLKDQLK